MFSRIFRSRLRIAGKRYTQIATFLSLSSDITRINEFLNHHLECQPATVYSELGFASHQLEYTIEDVNPKNFSTMDIRP